ncbi:MAG TPA: thiamine pyrophosphate-dependent enzyme [Candidatus Bipolaricaulis anaerobius]|jgi:2-oxoglutarate ferredoxin oxidoreductase subunit beta|uniref:3-methyl-2-oxobutanoate dehydrogenase (Ferredoxin)or 2-oxoisovalerate ferredoxin oxidoreductase, subunit alpha VorA n=1 Tax=Candidatus Bipolaricaulis anaerobius TaxID=2026885 RepID=A0A2X3KKV9_9BACT|nr:thiamine pyrophosphate-dependent enzyme [Candidatus Bipolaricaulis anaerobius]MDD3748467.1 thiamine pyrophosphate-dependent enzyme [Candidatus Bipolaricaulis anaerobius]MDD5763872.1 thiamine pyrophosphate-dependent enzyme [Candidatus Bipolaricaulis anaerobius]SQD93251.1 3-methyl-2-oxobutanoate dehydrogenase (ferredoxin)or 2-oxoisovalerate ferredoxin oxidoreductase, subunit alpha VorA [Candidatus Bipolaricaulis anaerobius]HNR24486.1 thiamine pyrophosphate-dependent enzyme [Candidatus Bipolari
MPEAETMVKVFARPTSLNEKHFTYCPGCDHGLITRLVAGAIDKLGVQERTVFIAPVGCAVFAYEWFRCDGIQASHGRAAAVATGLKRANPDLVVISYQGDGDLAAIGTAETIHAANRGEAITVIFVNNQIYGMTGGQMAPTTLPGQRATSCPEGRDVSTMGHPLPVAELIATLAAPAYVTRQSLHDPRHVAQATKAIEKALRYQVEGKGYSLVEILATCPTGWRMPPAAAHQHVADVVTGAFPLGDLVDRG